MPKPLSQKHVDDFCAFYGSAKAALAAARNWPHTHLGRSCLKDCDAMAEHKALVAELRRRAGAQSTDAA